MQEYILRFAIFAPSNDKAKMEQVSEKFVEQYGDFFFRLTTAQLQERIDEFKSKQPNVMTGLDVYAATFKSPQVADIIWRFTLLMVYCFESEGSIIPLISRPFLKQFEKDMIKRMKDFKPNSTADSFGQEATLYLNMNAYANWMADKLDNIEKQDQHLSFKQAASIHQVLILNGNVFRRAILAN